MHEIKGQLQELKQMMRVSFDLQLDIQRAIRQEVSAALAAFCTAPVTSAGAGGGTVPAAVAGKKYIPIRNTTLCIYALKSTT